MVQPGRPALDKLERGLRQILRIRRGADLIVDDLYGSFGLGPPQEALQEAVSIRAEQPARTDDADVVGVELKQGLLTGKVTMDTTYPEGSTRNSNPCFQPARRAQALKLLAGWQDLCEKYHCTPAQLVIALTARMIPGLHVLCGARTPEQAIDNAGALHIALEGADAVQMKWDVDAIS